MMLRTVAEILRRKQTEGWLVGGSVRDRELGRYSPDLDVAVAGDAAAVAKEIAGSLDAPWFALSERHMAYRVMGDEGHVDVAALRGSGIVDDLAERDFTVNAMAIPVGGEGLVDPFGGMAHLRQRRLVAVSERIFADDPLRLMRAPRFCHVLGLEADASLVSLAKAEAPLLAAAAAERVATEMILTLAEGRAADAVRRWHDLHLLAVILPEVVVSERLVSTIALLERLDDLLERPAAWFPAAADPLVERLAQPVDGALSRPVALRLAGLLHGLTAREAEVAGRRLKLSCDMISLLRAGSGEFSGSLGGVSAGGHDSAGGADEERASRAEVLFLWAAAPWEPEVVALAAAADGAAPNGRPGLAPSNLGSAQRIMALWARRALNGVPRPPLDGELIMREFGLESGPLVGKALREVRLAWEAGEATTLSEALAAGRVALGAG